VDDKSNKAISDFLANMKRREEEEAAAWEALPEDEKRRAEEEQRRREEAEARERLLASYKRRGIPPRFYDVSWDNWVHDTGDRLKAFQAVKDGAWKTNLFLCGKSGTGKTHLAMCLTKDGATYRRLPDIFREVRADFHSEQEIIENYGEAKLLIIDEVGRQKFSGFEKNLFFEIIDKRYNNMLPTTLVTNLSEKEFFAEYGTAILDRLRPVVARFTWESRRETLNIPEPQAEDDIDF
jgi:DNA replication protein DnaC